MKNEDIMYIRLRSIIDSINENKIKYIDFILEKSGTNLKSWTKEDILTCLLNAIGVKIWA